jgi:4-amino-4-deoxy-L-arabinose transferase-like glycosyltransferase
MNKKWFIYTVLIGMIPFFARVFIYLISKNVNETYVINAVDIAAFGLLLNITNINELESLESLDPVWKTTQIGISVFQIVLFSIFLTLAYLAEANPKFELSNVGIVGCASILALASFVFSYSIFNRINSLP